MNLYVFRSVYVESHTLSCLPSHAPSSPLSHALSSLPRQATTDTEVQHDNINMAVFFWYLVHYELWIIQCKPQYTGQVMFSRYQEHTAMYNWTLCTTDNIMMEPMRMLIQCSSGCLPDKLYRIRPQHGKILWRSEFGGVWNFIKSTRNMAISYGAALWFGGLYRVSELYPEDILRNSVP